MFCRSLYQNLSLYVVILLAIQCLARFYNAGPGCLLILSCSVPTLSVPLNLLAGNGASCHPSTNYGYMRLYFSLSDSPPEKLEIL